MSKEATQPTPPAPRPLRAQFRRCYPYGHVGWLSVEADQVHLDNRSGEYAAWHYERLQDEATHREGPR